MGLAILTGSYIWQWRVRITTSLPVFRQTFGYPSLTAVAQSIKHWPNLQNLPVPCDVKKEAKCKTFHVCFSFQWASTLTSMVTPIPTRLRGVAPPRAARTGVAGVVGSCPQKCPPGPSLPQGPRPLRRPLRHHQRVRSWAALAATPLASTSQTTTR